MVAGGKDSGPGAPGHLSSMWPPRSSCLLDGVSCDPLPSRCIWASVSPVASVAQAGQGVAEELPGRAKENREVEGQAFTSQFCPSQVGVTESVLLSGVGMVCPTLGVF